MPHRPRSLLAIAAILLAAATSPARAQFESDTLDSFVSAGFPRIAADPTDDTPHVSYERMGSLRHRWLDGGVWLDEEIASGGSIGDLAVGPTGRPAAVQFAPGGLVIVHRRDAGTWTPDTIPTLIPSGSITFGGSLAIDSADEPVFVWLFRDSGGSVRHLRLARRSAGTWSVAELDTSTSNVQLPSLAVDQADRPRLSISHPRGFGDGPGNYYGEAAGPLGPWSWTLIDPLLYASGSFTALALDPVTDEPRMVYESPFRLHYAYRASGSWTTQIALQMAVTNSSRPVSLALSPSGGPQIAYTIDFNFGVPTGPGEPGEAIASCGGGVFTPRVHHLERALAEGAGAFTAEELGNSFNSRVSPRAVISTVGDGSQVIWRDPWIWAAGCTNYMIYSQRASTVGVPILTPPDVGLAIGPNPLRGGAPLTVAFRLAREETVTLRLIDVAGRTVARSTQRLGPGPRSLAWAPPNVASGAYRLVVDTGVTRLGARSVVVID